MTTSADRIHPSEPPAFADAEQARHDAPRRAARPGMSLIRLSAADRFVIVAAMLVVLWASVLAVIG